MSDLSPVEAARLLRRSATAATLATVTDGQPFASLIAPAPAPDGSVLMLLSDLSEHTRHLRQEPRCSLLLTAPSDDPNPQAGARLTLTGLAHPDPDRALHARWVARHPYAAFYADFGDFHIFRLAPAAGLYIGGFASATRLRRADLTPDPDAVAAVMAAEAEIIAHCNGDHADTLALLAGQPGAWRMTACDVDGCDLAQDERVRRIAWPHPVVDASGVRQALILLAHAARKALESGPGPGQ